MVPFIKRSYLFLFFEVFFCSGYRVYGYSRLSIHRKFIFENVFHQTCKIEFYLIHFLQYTSKNFFAQLFCVAKEKSAVKSKTSRKYFINDFCRIHICALFVILYLYKGFRLYGAIFVNRS